MQQTEKYKLNLIEKNDPFSPDPLNENAQKLEAALETARAGTAALEQRVSVLELHKYVAGYHGGSGFVDLGFTPVAVFAIGDKGNGFAIAGYGLNGLGIAEGGFEHASYFTNCRYVAFA